MEKTIRICAVLGFCLFLGGMLLLFLLLPKETFSQNEKRYLAQAPRLQAEDVLSGRFADEAEHWAADHLPGREFFVGLNARYELVSGREAVRSIYRGKSGRLYEAPVAPDAAALARNMESINAFAAAAGQPVDLLLIPSAGWTLQGDLPKFCDPYPDAEIIAGAFARAEAPLRPVPLAEAFAAAEEPGRLYFRTDHHWTSEGAWLAAELYLRGVGRELPPKEAYTVREEDGFFGTTYARAALWDTPAETLELWDSGTRFQVENGESEGVLHDGLFYEERLTENDKYPVFLDGNHSLVRIRNLSGRGNGKLLLVRDSFSNMLGCFLAESYEETVLVDLRYYRGAVSELLRSEDFDNVLIAYSVANFMTDSHLPGLD